MYPWMKTRQGFDGLPTASAQILQPSEEVTVFTSALRRREGEREDEAIDAVAFSCSGTEAVGGEI